MEVVDGGLALFADLTSLVTCCDSERGLLSIALAPDFDASGRFYAAYTGTTAAGGAKATSTRLLRPPAAGGLDAASRS